VGLRERCHQHREAGIPCFPEHWGGVCEAGSEFEKGKAEEEKGRWDRRPPAKRAEWGSLGTRWPWKPNWEVIIKVGTFETGA
jgi:ribonuclease P/MRP protein subunit POP1